MARKNTIRTTLIAVAEYTFLTEGGQEMKSYLPAGTVLILPANWIYEPESVVRGEVKDDE